jgi:hypothetical protein
MDIETTFTIFASILSWALASSIIRYSGTIGQRSLPTLLLGMVALIVVHIAPFYFNGWLFGAGILLGSYIVAGVVSGLYVGSYVRSEDWPENFLWHIRYGPALLNLISIVLVVLLFWNKLK